MSLTAPGFWARLPRAWWFQSLVIAAFGTFFRYRDLSAQAVLDDEWHSLFHAAQYDARTIATEHSRMATSMPLNLYHRALLAVGSWSEVSIRFLTILASLATLVLLPWFVLKLFGSKRMALLSGVAFACSQFWIFYGLSARPYAAFLLFLLVGYYSLYRVLMERDASSVVIFAVSGALGVYFHLFALPALAAPVVLWVWKVAQAVKSEGIRGAEPLRLAQRGLAAYALWTTLVAALLWPAAALGLPLPSELPRGAYNLQFLHEGVELLTGARFQLVAWPMLLAALVGIWLAVQKNRTFMAIVGFGLLGSMALTLKQRPNQFEVALVTFRYNITFFILYFIGLGAFLDEACERAWRWLGTRLSRWPEQSGQASVVAAFGALCIGVSPIPRDLSIRPNNFRLHSAYQESYSGWDPSRTYWSAFFGQSMNRDVNSIPEPYLRLSQLARDGKHCRIVEYPSIKEDHENPFYFYQLHHHCEVVIGYSAGELFGKGLHTGEYAARFRFKQLTDVEDIEHLAKRRVDYVMVHLDLRAEALNKGHKRNPSRETKRVLASLKKALGEPVASDDWVQLFEVPKDAVTSAPR